MPRMFQLANVFELVVDGLNQSALAEQNFIQEREQAGLHLFFEFGDEWDSLIPKLSDEGLGDVAALPHQLAKQAASKFRHGRAVIDVARSEHNGPKLPAVVNDQRDF